MSRATFGQNVGPFRKQVGCAVEFYFEGMSPKTVTSMTAPSSPLSAPSAVEMPASPILKAQLCAPPKPSTTRKDAPKTVIHLSFHFIPFWIIIYLFICLLIYSVILIFFFISFTSFLNVCVARRISKKKKVGRSSSHFVSAKRTKNLRWIPNNWKNLERIFGACRTLKKSFMLQHINFVVVVAVVVVSRFIRRLIYASL